MAIKVYSSSFSFYCSKNRYFSNKPIFFQNEKEIKENLQQASLTCTLKIWLKLLSDNLLAKQRKLVAYEREPTLLKINLRVNKFQTSSCKAAFYSEAFCKKWCY